MRREQTAQWRFWRRSLDRRDHTFRIRPSAARLGAVRSLVLRPTSLVSIRSAATKDDAPFSTDASGSCLKVGLARTGEPSRNPDARIAPTLLRRVALWSGPRFFQKWGPFEMRRVLGAWICHHSLARGGTRSDMVSPSRGSLMKSYRLLFLLFTIGCSSELSGPEACVAAGGRCVLGNEICSNRGSEDCNPERNPGGAFCCLSCPPVDAGADAGTECHPAL